MLARKKAELHDTVSVSIMYTLLVPGLWSAARQLSLISPPKDDVSQRLNEMAKDADSTYQHPRQLKSIARFPLNDGAVDCNTTGQKYRAGVLLLTSEDDLAVLSVTLLDVPWNIDVIFSLLEGSRGLRGRYRSNEFPLEQVSTSVSNTTHGVFIQAMTRICGACNLGWPKHSAVDYYPFITFCDANERYSKEHRTEEHNRELAAIISAEKGHSKSLESGWASRHLGSDLSHTLSREFYVTEQGAIYLIFTQREAGLLQGGWSSERVTKKLLQRTMAVLTFLEIYRSQVVLLRNLDRALDQLLRSGFKTAGLREVIRFYVESMQSLTRYENLAVQTTPWRKYAWRHIRQNCLLEPFESLSLKLERVEKIMDMFDRLRVQTVLICLYILLAVLSIVSSTQWRIGIKISIVLLLSIAFISLIWYFLDLWWRRKLFRHSPAAIIQSLEDKAQP